LIFHKIILPSHENCLKISQSKVLPEDKKILKQLLDGKKQVIREFVLIAQDAMVMRGLKRDFITQSS
jgi:hypothetical protein